MLPEKVGVAHEPSPRQKVVASAPVPPAKLVTGRFPVTIEDRSIAASVQFTTVPVASTRQKLFAVSAPQ